MYSIYTCVYYKNMKLAEAQRNKLLQKTPEALIDLFTAKIRKKAEISN